MRIPEEQALRVDGGQILPLEALVSDQGGLNRGNPIRYCVS